MQSKTAPPRDHLTATQVTDLIEADALQVDFGADLYDSDETFIEDISGDLAGGEVERGNFRTIHGTCRLAISKELAWGSQRIKPYMTLSDGTVEARFNLGVFLLSTPERQAGESPATFDVDGFDKLEVLAHPHGSTYSASSGDAYLTLVEDLIAGAGESKVRLDQAESSTTLSSGRVWDLETTTLTIVNSLLRAVGYRSLWVDQDGYYRSEPYVSPADRGADWDYSADSATTTVGQERTASADFFATPNRWVFVLDDPEASTFPSEGDGIYTVTNQSDGDTSVDARGRTITRVEFLDASSQTSLETQGDRMVESDKRLDRRLALNVSPNPLHRHFDIVRVFDAELGVNGRKYVVTDWRLPLDGSDMQLDLKAT